MKRALRIIGILLLCFGIIWCLYVTIDAIRLRTMKLGLKPLITLEEVKENTKIYYKGLGYSITYQVQAKQDYDLVLVNILGAEFRLFDKFLIWAWIV